MVEGDVLKIGIIGCGYVFDHYMSTIKLHPMLDVAAISDIRIEAAQRASRFYGLEYRADNSMIFNDPEIVLIVNLTSIESHYEVTKTALEAGKHVYCEKPIVTSLPQAKELFALARERRLHLSGAPCNMLSDTSLTMWKAVKDGAIGDARIVYAEFDDNPIYLMAPEKWRSRSGAPWPYLHEYEMGCTWEHVGYHLAWMCAIFGPVRSVTAFSKVTAPDKTGDLATQFETPDFSVACLDFHSGVVGRVTCSIAVPFDHRMRIIGNKGMVHADTYRHYRCPVYLEHFSKLNLNARKSRTVRTNSALQWMFGVGGRRLSLLKLPPPGQHTPVDILGSRHWLDPRQMINRLKRSELGQQDKCLGVAELANAIVTRTSPLPGPDFLLHLTEITLAIQAAGPAGSSTTLQTHFDPLVLPQAANASRKIQLASKANIFESLLNKLIDRMHQH